MLDKKAIVSKRQAINNISINSAAILFSILGKASTS
jgi:hypothetical protein